MKFEEFLVYHTINDENEVDKIRIAFDFLSDPYNVNSMITLIDLGLTPMSAVAYNIEQLVDCTSLLTRQTIGRVVSFILSKYGYTITNERARLRTFSNTKYFTTGALYKKDNSIEAEYKIVVKSERKVK